MRELSDRSLRYRLHVAAAMAALLPALFGGALMSVVGYYSPGDIVRVAAGAPGLYVLGVGAVGVLLVGRLSDWLVSIAREPLASSDGRVAQRLRRLPVYLMAAVSIYSVLGIAILDATLVGRGLMLPLSPTRRLAHLVATVLPILSTALPLFFVLKSTLDRYLAPRGVLVAAIPLRTKLVVTALAVPILVDVMLLAYFTNRDGALDRTALWIWLGLLIVAVANVLMGCRELARDLRPLEGLIASTHDLARARAVLVPMSLDELGVVTGRLREWLAEEQHLRHNLDVLTERLVEATSAADLGIVDHDLRTNTIYWSEGLRRLYGVGAEEPVDPSLLERYVHPEDIDRVMRAIKACRDPALGGRLSVEHRIVRPGGEVRWLTCHGKTMFVEEGGVRRAVRTIGTIRDSTERIESLERRRALELDLQEARRRETLGTFAGGIAHDFNNLLMVINGSLEHLRQALPRDPELEGALNLMELSSRRGRDLVEQLSAFARGQRQVAEPVVAREAVNEGVELVRATIGSGVALEVELDSDGQVLCGGGQLQQVTCNLVKNAVQAVEPRGGVVRVALHAVKVRNNDPVAPAACGAGAWVRLVVSDTGVGMSPATLKRLFEPFFSTRRAGAGTGLGLAVVDTIVRSLGGTIRVNSVEGFGSTFEIWLPAVAASASGESAPAQGGMSKGRRLLYIDDNPVCGELLARALNRRQWHVTVEASPAAGIARLRAQPEAFDVVVTDFQMPAASGLEVAEMIKAINPSLPVIVLTGAVTDRLHRQAEASDVLAVVGKVGSLEAIAEEVERVIERRAVA